MTVKEEYIQAHIEDIEGRIATARNRIRIYTVSQEKIIFRLKKRIDEKKRLLGFSPENLSQETKP